jgi:hypothetical protein
MKRFYSSVTTVVGRRPAAATSTKITANIPKRPIIRRPEGIRENLIEDPGAIPVALLIPLTIVFPLAWGIHSLRLNYGNDFRFKKRDRKAFVRGDLEKDLAKDMGEK